MKHTRPYCQPIGKPLLIVFAVLAAMLATAACDGSAGDKHHADAGSTPAAVAAASQPESGFATGTVRDSRGEPIAGAKVVLSNTVFRRSFIEGVTKADGSYRLPLQPGMWNAKATFRKEYNGRTYRLHLHPHNEQSFDPEGAVRDFTWKLEGRSEENRYRYYGGLIEIFTTEDFLDSDDDIRLTLVPDGPLIDGSPGRTLQLRRGDHYWDSGRTIEDVPIGRYIASASLENESGSRPLRVGPRDDKQPLAAQMQLDFIPDGSNTPGSKADIVIGH